MYDPRYGYHFPELDDPQFWADVARTSSAPPQTMMPTTMSYPPEAWSPLDLRESMVVESWLITAPTGAAAYPSPISKPRPPVAQRSTSRGGTIPFLLVCLIIGMLSVLFFTPTTATPNKSYSLYENPSINANLIGQVLDHYGSPAAAYSQNLYDLGIKYGVDPVFPLAFFMKESTFGTKGVARTTLSLSNMRCVREYACYHTANSGSYAQFPDWPTGFEAWYQLITGPLYKGSGLMTVNQITKRYAPKEDHNDPASYTCFVEYATDTWRGGTIVVRTPPASYCSSKASG